MKFCEMKRAAKDSLRGNWGKAAGITFVYTIIISILVGIYTVANSGNIMNYASLNPANYADMMDMYADMMGSVFNTSYFVLLLVSFFVISPISVGLVSVFFKISKGEETGIKDMFSMFSSRYGSLLKLILWITLFVFLWGLLYFATIMVIVLLSSLIVIFGTTNWVISALMTLLIIAVFIGYMLIILRYQMSFYIFIDNPGIGCRDTLNRSKRIMKGNLWRYILLSLSFIGWAILCLLIIPIFWIWPYMEVTYINFYKSINGEDSIPQIDEIETV